MSRIALIGLDFKLAQIRLLIFFTNLVARSGGRLNAKIDVFAQI